MKNSFGAILSEKEHGKELGEEIMEKANKKLADISHEFGKEIITVKVHGR